MNPIAILTTFVAIFPAELPDKTMVASMVLSTRYRHPWAVWLGATAGVHPGRGHRGIMNEALVARGRCRSEPGRPSTTMAG